MITIQMQPLTPDLKTKIYEGFGRHSISMTGHDELFDPIAFVATAKDNTFAGAVVAELFWGAFHIKYVYIPDEYRSQGIGSQMMEKALAYAQEQKCPFAFVETMSFQALDFYKKLGFQIEFTRGGYSHKTSFHYLRKDL